MTAVFALSEFDPASVVLSHRDALRAGRSTAERVPDLRLAVHTSYTEVQRSADWVRVQFDHYDHALDKTRYTEIPLDPAMLDFAACADIFQIHPGIGQPWASEDMAPRYGTSDDPPLADYMGVRWEECFRSARSRIAFFHGSRCAWTNRDGYAKHYRELGCAIAASTLDYAVALDAAWLPPAAPIYAERAPLRSDDDPLIVAHTPTDPSNCGTEEFMRAARSLGIVVRFATNVPASEAVEAKRGAHACYDHMRGSFSVNTLEGCALGCVPLVGLSERCWERMVDDGFDPIEPRITDFNSLVAWLLRLRDDPALTRSLQEQSWRYARSQFGVQRIAAKLAAYYEGL